MSIQLTREELYEMVWERPVTEVADELNISDAALHKISLYLVICFLGRPS